MAVLADAVEEFKSASPGGKALMLVAVIAVAGVAIYAWRLKTASSGSSSQGTLVPIDTSGGVSGFGGTPSTGNGTTTPPTTTPTPPTILPPDVTGGNNKPPNGIFFKPQPTGTYVTVGKFGTGDWTSTLWSIAQHFYGNGAQWQRIAQANNISNPRALQPGQRLFVPQ